ncbi:MAG: carboxymuconolactone decarboxylase family protein [Gammaproteobacteria bacterium]|nr:carboxymuconolactone decarboxylase family protein [Gammaproteobacteria bacterium]MDH3431997.1 carboxymuconolactone decarboxylase family protein [Gammaproteobacteria bacterium]MDH3433718.1 carboxymuconolactone decarboxylase family protein [Gammaproteobacteria bacterium]
MDERMKELVAMGASAAANCHPCMDHHLAKCDELGIDRAEVIAAVKVGLMVNRGAEKAIRKKTRELLGETAADD